MDAGLIAMRMRLSGGKEVAAEAETATAAVEETSAATETANRKAKGVGNGIRSSLTKQIAAMRTIGRSLTKYVTVPLAAIAIGSGVMAAHFDRSMNLVATDAGGSVKEVAKLKGQVLDLARHSQFGPQKLADSLFHVESSGYRGAKAIRVLNEAQKLATAGNSDLEKTTYALVSAQKALTTGDSLKGVTKTAAQLNEIVSHGDIRLEELTSAMSTGLLPTAKALGLSVADVGSALDVMTKRGIPAQRSAYALNFTLQKLIPSTEKAQEAFANLGLGEEQLLKTAQKKGLPAALGLLRDKLSGLTRGRQIQVIDEMFGGGRMSKGLLVAIQHVGEMKELWGQVDGNVGLYKKHVREAENQPMVKAQRAWSSIQAGLIEIGQVLLPATLPLMEHLAGILAGAAAGFGHLPQSTQHTIVLVGVLAAALGPVLLMVAKILELWKSINELTLVQKGTAGMTKGRLAVAATGVAAAQIGGQAIGGKTGSAVTNIGTGAAVGFGAGGPWGAAAGAGIGAALTYGPDLMHMLGAIGGSSKTMQQKVAAAFEQVGKGMGQLHAQGHRLVASEDALSGAHRKARAAVRAQGRAFDALQQARKESGPMSRKVLLAEQRYATSIRDANKALRNQAKARREHGAALVAEKEDLSENVLVDRHAINTAHEGIKVARARLEKMRDEGKGVTETAGIRKSLLEDEKKLKTAHHNLNQVYAESSEKVGPKYTEYLHHATQMTLRYGNQVKGLRQELELVIEAEESMSAAQGRGIVHGARRQTERELQEAQREENERRPHHHGHHPPPRARKSTGEPSAGSSAVHKLLSGGGAPQKVHHQPIIVALDRRGKKTIAETTVEIQDDEDARA